MESLFANGYIFVFAGRGHFFVGIYSGRDSYANRGKVGVMKRITILDDRIGVFRFGKSRKYVKPT